MQVRPPAVDPQLNIGMADNTGLKFCNDLKEHWEATHNVRYERGASEFIAQWANVYYVEWIDGNLNYLWKLYHGQQEIPDTLQWDNNKKPKIICRLIDWDVWVEHVPFYDQQYIDFVDVGVVIAEHIRKRILEKAPQWEGKLKLIKPGVNTEKFPLKTKETDGYQIGMVLGDMWWPKNHMGGLDIFTTLYNKDNRWRLHIRGQHELGNYWKVMYEEYLKSRGIADVVTLYPPVDDMNQWYENIDYLLHPGMKEAFSYATAEAMSKGIKPVINNFYGAEDIWPKEILYNTHEEAIRMFYQPGNVVKPNEDYRRYIRDNYGLKRYFEEMDALL